MTERWKKEHPEELQKYLKHWEDELARINAESAAGAAAKDGAQKK